MACKIATCSCLKRERERLREKEREERYLHGQDIDCRYIKKGKKHNKVGEQIIDVKFIHISRTED